LKFAFRNRWVFIGGLVVSLTGLAQDTLLPNVPAPVLKSIGALISAGSQAAKNKSLELSEKEYQTLFQRHLFSELIRVYDPKSGIPVQVTFASFTPEASKGGKDGGFGLHIVKRFRIREPGGRSRVIDVNEQWPEDKKTGGLHYPNEIRVKIETYDGPAGVPGAERRYLFDLFNPVYGEKRDEIKICRRTKYLPAGEKKLFKKMRSRISAPFSCYTCHRPEVDLGESFRADGEAREYENIVSDAYFDTPARETFGIRRYVDALRQLGVSPETIENWVGRLVEAPRGPEIPEFVRALSTASQSAPCWLEEDETLGELAEGQELWQGIYWQQGKNYRDAAEKVYSGKYEKWLPRLFFP